ncbi:hypothetical protein [Pseudomonas sp. EA_35y_Pfl2_R111]|uniref:hypothetical protein n=1 Tax=Pseudomonas sp. EA_35y_Pfl2_R111 TaxID=3088689 RepID=UPI0030D76BA4
MNNNLRRLYMLLAAADFHREEVEDLLYDLRDMGVKKVVSDFDKFSRSGFSSREPQSLSRSHTQPSEYGVDRKVYDLLVHECNMSAGQAFVMFEGILQEIYPERKFSSPNPKSGFAAWIRSLGKSFTDSELLHVASRLRNQIVHGLNESSDWVLRE